MGEVKLPAEQAQQAIVSQNIIKKQFEIQKI
jgi:hypothetical protein